MAIRTLLVPFAYVVSLALKKLKTSIYAVVTFSFFVIFSTIIAFYMVLAAGFNTEVYEALTVIGIFLTGLIDEVIRERGRAKKQQPSFPLALARHSDLLLVFGILYILAVQPYGITPALTLGEGAYAAIGGAMLVGIVIVSFVAKGIEKREPGIETRAERMFLLTGFMLVGYYFNDFLLAVFAGIAGMTLYLYLWVIWKKFDFYRTGEALYTLLSRIWRRISATGLPDIPKPKVPSRESISTEDGFQEYADEDYSTNGYNFTAVVNDRRSEPVSNVKITLNNLETGETYNGYTDPSGRASFVGASEGQYNIKLECEGFRGTEFERYISMDSGEVFVLKRPFTDLSIVITDKKKTTPVPSAKVSIRLQGKNGSEMKKSADNLGVAYFDDLDVSVCEIHVAAEGYKVWERSINLEEENVVSVNLEQGENSAEQEPKAPEDGSQVQEEPKLKEEKSHAPREEVSLAEVLSESALFEYHSPEDVHTVVSLMVEEYKKHDMGIYLVSTPERAQEYAGLDVNIIDTPTDLGQFKSVLEEMPAGSVLIFEPLSNLILTSGFDPAQKFIKKTLGYMKGEGLSLACFLNPEAHEGHELKKLRKTLKSVTIEGDKIFR